MIGVLVIAHTPLASALRDGVLHVFPDAAPAIAALDVQPHDAPEDTFEQARGLIQRLGTHQVLVVADMFGATPCNIAQRLTDGHQIRLVTGANLPMLLRAINYRHESLDALVSRAMAGGTQGIISPAATAPQNQLRRSHHDQNHHDHQQ
jgi:PTS system ascorbate-specific IIA component